LCAEVVTGIVDGNFNCPLRSTAIGGILLVHNETLKKTVIIIFYKQQHKLQTAPCAFSKRSIYF